MVDKELKQLSRMELLEMLIEQEKENMRLQAEVEELKQKLSEKEITVKEAGTLAEASLKLNGIFEAADSAAKQYLDNVRNIKIDYDSVIAEARNKADEIIMEAEKQKAEKEKEAQAHLNQLMDKLEVFYESHPGLKEYLKSEKGK